MKKSTLLLLLVVIFGGGLLLLGKGRAPSTQNTKTLEPLGKTTEGSSAQTDNNKLAPDFSLQTLEGQTITLSDYRGKKAVMLDFWATWCPNCRRDMPKMDTFYKKYQEDVEVIAINLQEKEGTVKKYLDEKGFSFISVLDPDSVASRAYGIFATNTHVLIDKEGNLVKIIPGDVKEADFQLLTQ